MSDFEKNEIEKIQQDIERDLQGGDKKADNGRDSIYGRNEMIIDASPINISTIAAPPLGTSSSGVAAFGGSSGSAGDPFGVTAAEGTEGETGTSAQTGTASPSESAPYGTGSPMGSTSPMTAVPPRAASPQPPAKEVFYKETIRNDSGRHSKGSFKRTVAVACIVSILGGSCIGTFIGVGSKVAEKIIFPKMSINSTSSGNNNGTEENGFTFSESGFGSAYANTDIRPDNGLVYVSLSDVVNKIEPTVVAITSSVKTAAPQIQSPLDRFFYGNGMIADIPQTGLGSGIIFHEDENNIYIATNYHVIESAYQVMISVSGSVEVPAKLVGRDPESDLAVISVTKKDLQDNGVNSIILARFGDSDKMQVGDTVLAVGNALGEGNTATQGIVSAKDKQIKVENKTLNVIQTDAAINPGNSGGPLVNLKGEVIGINTAKLSQSNVEGMGYSISANIAKPIIESLMSQSSKPFLGIRGTTLTANDARMYNLPQLGVVIVEVIENSSAYNAGLKPTDIITSFNNTPVLTWEDLIESMKNCNIGDEVDVKIIRRGKTQMNVKVKLIEQVGSF